MAEVNSSEKLTEHGINFSVHLLPNRNQSPKPATVPGLIVFDILRNRVYIIRRTTRKHVEAAPGEAETERIREMS